MDVKAEIIGDVNAYLASIETAIDAELVKALVDAALHAEGELKQTIMETFPSGGTGQLARNPKAVLLDSGGEVKSSAALMDLVYADIQDKGGTVKPKSTKYLAIPLTAESRTPGKWPRTWAKGELTCLKSKKGNLILARVKGKKIEPQYVLKKSVRIEGQGYIKRARDAAMAGITEIVGRHIRTAISSGRVTA